MPTPTTGRETTPELPEVLSGGEMSEKALLLGSDFADRLDDGAQGIADAELGDAGPYEDAHTEDLPADLRPDQIEHADFDAAEDADLTSEDQEIDLGHMEGNFRGEGEADLHAQREGGERTAAVADETQYRPHGPVTAAPTRKH
jgi:hypothetical protein